MKRVSASELRRRLKERVDGLSVKRLRVADEFLAYLEQRESIEATEELLRIPGLLERVRAAEADYRKHGGVDWRVLRPRRSR